MKSGVPQQAAGARVGAMGVGEADRFRKLGVK